MTLTNKRLEEIRDGAGPSTSEAMAIINRLLAAEAQLAELRGQAPLGCIEVEDGAIIDYRIPAAGLSNGWHDLFANPVPPAASQPSYRDGIEAAAKWLDKQRESFDNEHGRHDPDTGTFEFGNDAQLEYSSTLAELSEGIRALQPAASQPQKYRMGSLSESEIDEFFKNLKLGTITVPEEATLENIQVLSRNGGWHKMDESECHMAVDVWNACRTAMLQSANSNGVE